MPLFKRYARKHQRQFEAGLRRLRYGLAPSLGNIKSSKNRPGLTFFETSRLRVQTSQSDWFATSGTWSFVIELKTWFVSIGQSVVGPLTTSACEDLVQKNPEAVVWWIGAAAWVSPGTWRATKNSLETKLETYFYLDHERHISRTFEEALDLLRPGYRLELIKFWCPPLERAQSVFEIPALCRVLGLPEREPRVPLVGLVLIQLSERLIMAQAKNLSVGGLGARVLSNVSLSGEVLLSVQSADGINVGPIKADVVFHRDDRAGFKFTDIHSNGKAQIENFVLQKKRFQDVET